MSTKYKESRDNANQQAFAICKRIAGEHGVSIKDMIAKNRGFQHEADARAWAMHEIRDTLGWTWQRIANFFDKKDHATAIRAYDKVQDLIELEKLKAKRKGGKR